MHRPGQGVFEFYPTGPRDFFLSTGNDELSIELDDRGRAVTLILFGDGRAAGGGLPARRLD